MSSFKKDYAGPTRFMYYIPWRSKDVMIRTKRRMPKSIIIDNKEINAPLQLISSFHDVNTIQKFWQNSYETSEFKCITTGTTIQSMFKNNGICLALNDNDQNIFATLFSYEPNGHVYINGNQKKVRFIEGAVINHKKKDVILHWLFSWMEYLEPSIYIYTDDSLNLNICTPYITYHYYGISKSFIKNDTVGDVERINSSEFSKYQEMFIKKYNSNINLIYSLNSENADIELYKVPVKFHSNSYYIIGVKNNHAIYKKYNLATYEVIFCAIIARNEIIIQPSEEEMFLTRYAIESVCKAGSYPMLLVSSKEISGDIYEYDTIWKKFTIEKKKLYIYNYLANGFTNPTIYFPK
jgi:hypothetical protein